MYWRSVLWTDESRFTIEFADGRVRVRRLPNERFAPCCTMERDRYGGGSVMVWGGIWYNGKSACVNVVGNMNSLNYRDNIVLPHIVPIVHENNLILQQDNARPHVALVVRQTLNENNVELLPWPAKSPDLSPIEHLWDVIGINLRARNPAPATIAHLVNWSH